MSDLRQRIAAARHRVAVDLTPEEVSKGLIALHARARQRLIRRRGAGGAVVLVALAALVLARREKPDHAPIAIAPVAVRAVAPPAAPARPAREEAPEPALAPLVYRDGSRATPLGPRSQVRLLEQRTTMIQTQVVFGGGRFEVAKNPQRRFQVLAGLLVVEAIGTVFTVERASEDVWIGVEEGRVRVTGPGVAAVLEASERRRFPDVAGGSPAAIIARAAPLEPRPAVKATATEHTTAMAGVEAGAPKPTPGFVPGPLEPLALPSSPVVPTQEDVVDRSLRDADRARAAGQYGPAAAMLRRVTEQTNDARAPLAGFTLGRLLLEKLNQPTEAAAAFVEVQRLSPDGDLAEDALAREVESWHAAGRTDQAHARAAIYLQRYPQGRRSDEVRRWGGAP